MKIQLSIFINMITKEQLLPMVPFLLSQTVGQQSKNGRSNLSTKDTPFKEQSLDSILTQENVLLMIRRLFTAKTAIYKNARRLSSPTPDIRSTTRCSTCTIMEHARPNKE